MKYAIMSDIHGNYHAFRAVLEDARAQVVDMYLLLGDYASSFPYGNAVTKEIRKIKPAVVIGGNGERYFSNLVGRDPAELTHEQFKPVYWGYNSLSKENLEYLISLPETAVVMDGDIRIHLAHSRGLFYRWPKIELLHSDHYRVYMEAAPFSHDEYLVRARDALMACPEAVAEIEAMPRGIYLFGHNHLQFHMEYDGRMFINPGACGEPLDWDTRAPYTILTIDGEKSTVTERRVEYDLEQAVDGLETSGFAAYAPMWSEVLKLDLTTAKDYFAYFVDHVVETSRKMGETTQPVSNKAWDVAVASWVAST